MKQVLIFLLCYLSSLTVSAWNDHANMTAIVLNAWAEANVPRKDAISTPANFLNQMIKAESLANFLKATELTLPAKLLKIEKWLLAHEKGYRPLPSELTYTFANPECVKDLETCFKKALRINLDVPMPLMVYDPNGIYLGLKGSKKLTSHEIMLRQLVTANNYPFTEIAENTPVRLADVIATGSIQPDFGMDIFLYENNPSRFGKLYGFGTQPIGIANIPFSSQILFHMSTYDEDKLFFWLMPRLQEDFPEARAYLYFELAKFAKEEGHLYWAAMFLGWGLHYVQDMTQPYHSRLSLGLNKAKTAYAQILALLGKEEMLAELKNIQSNRHLIFEGMVAEILSDHQPDLAPYKKLAIKALADSNIDSELPACNLSHLYLRKQINPAISKIANNYVLLIKETFPKTYIDDAKFNAMNFEQYHALFMNELSASRRLRFTQGLTEALTLFGAYTRKCIEFYGMGMQ